MKRKEGNNVKKIGILVSLLMLVLTACSANEDKKTAV